MKTIFIVTGFKQKKDSSQFKWMRPFFKNLGYQVKIFAADWNYHVMSDYVADFKAYYENNKGDKNYVLGFSFGAMIALLSARELLPDRLYLCSLSPYFKEDISKLRKDWQRMIGLRRQKDFIYHSYVRAARGLNIPSVVLYGEVEGKSFTTLKKRCEQIHKLLPQSELAIIPNAPHKIDYPEYVRVIKSFF